MWSKPTLNSTFDMIKARIFMDDVRATTAHDVLHDALYRERWDKYVHNATDIGLINPNNDMCYYAIKAMPPFQDRDFVLQRSWLDMGNEKFICSHSVSHEKYPPVKGYIRTTMFLTAYLIQEVGEGCQSTYITHADPKACKSYPKWKSDHHPEWNPVNFLRITMS
uniref:START domain-containing protein n=1 Tax=Syphacia muris TaxID=451379 RepID=A0A158R6C3_9BILA